MDLAIFSTQKIELFLLVFARTAGIFTLIPVFGASQTPVQVRILIALSLSVIFVPLANFEGNTTAGIFEFALLFARETIIGLIIGFVCNVIMMAIQVAGQLMDSQSGFGFAAMVDPSQQAPTSVAARFHYLVAGLLFFAVNAHHIMIQGLADSFYVAPVGVMALNSMVAGGAIELFASLFSISLRIAAPVVAASFMADLSLAITARLVPQMNVLIVGLPLKLGVGLVGLLVAMPIIAANSKGLFDDLYNQTMNLLRLAAA